MNPIWTQMMYKAVKDVAKQCAYCKKVAVYAQKPAGKFYKCRHCGHRFKEKGR